MHDQTERTVDGSDLGAPVGASGAAVAGAALVGPSAADLERFLSDLSARRERLLAIAGREPQRALVEELVELGERLLVADEELRVQQEELVAVQRRLSEHTAERELLVSTVPAVRTDLRGQLVLVNLAAARLAQRSSLHNGRMPLASWFVLADRPRVRDLITRAVRSGRPQSAECLRISQPASGAENEVEVRVAVEDGEPATLHWRLLPASTAPEQVAGMHLPGAGVLAEDLAALAVDLVPQRTAVEVLQVAARAVVGLVPGAEEATLCVVKGSTVELVESSAGGALELESFGFSAEDGPGCEALERPGEVVVEDDLASTSRWPSLRVVSRVQGLRSVASVAVALPTNRRRLVLSVYASPTQRFASAEVDRAVLLAAAHVSVAVDRVLTEENLSAAVATRQLIGEAVGVLAVREKLSREEAFARLVSMSQHSQRSVRDLAEQVSQRLR